MGLKAQTPRAERGRIGRGGILPLRYGALGWRLANRELERQSGYGETSIGNQGRHILHRGISRVGVSEADTQLLLPLDR
jgi:hypothetical protein